MLMLLSPDIENNLMFPCETLKHQFTRYRKRLKRLPYAVKLTTAYGKKTEKSSQNMLRKSALCDITKNILIHCVFKQVKGRM